MIWAFMNIDTYQEVLHLSPNLGLHVAYTHTRALYCQKGIRFKVNLNNKVLHS